METTLQFSHYYFTVIETLATDNLNALTVWFPQKLDWTCAYS